MSATPIANCELIDLFACLEGRGHVALAVSGGADSLALMHLMARWCALKGLAAPKPTVLTVDHGLRAASAAEAAHVARLARGLGFKPVLLRWDAEKPTSNLQSAARAARYDLMAAHCHTAGIAAMVTAHHLEDQAETVLMRLGRGSGVDGLAAIPEVSAWAGIDLLRPLLDLRKARLIATLEAAGVDWIEDPSNLNERFERVRVRRALERLESLGLTADRLALTARRMRRARAALDAATSELLERELTLGVAGDCRVPADALCHAPEEIALRAI
ncbi:MAG: tRNA lysidine(34) synthetase TilS, partial [Methyloligellaceae bacterium]